MAAPTILDALRSPSLLGALPAFRRLATWRAWLVFLAAVYGLPLSALGAVGIAEDEALHLFCEHTGRTTYDPPPGGYPTNVCITGRQSGKTRIGGTIVDFEAISAVPEPDGTELYALLVSQDARAALRTIFSYAAGPFESVPALRQMVPSGWRGLWQKARRVDSLTLSTGVRIAAYPCRPAAVRGLRARVVVLDELAFYRSSEGYPTDAEMLRAVRPCLATTGGKLVVLSSPYSQSGALYDLHRRHFGRDDSTTLVWVASAPAMNPTLPADYLARMREEDPEAARSEIDGEFRTGVATFLDPEAVAACVEAGVRERPPETAREYLAHFDASGGRRDAAALAIAHAEGGRAVLDVIRAWPSPHNPSSVVAEACDVLRRYRVTQITGDRYSGEFVAEQFRAHRVEYRASERDRSALYLELLPTINAAPSCCSTRGSCCGSCGAWSGGVGRAGAIGWTIGRGRTTIARSRRPGRSSRRRARARRCR